MRRNNPSYKIIVSPKLSSKFNRFMFANNTNMNAHATKARVPSLVSPAVIFNDAIKLSKINSNLVIFCKRINSISSNIFLDFKSILVVNILVFDLTHK